MSLMSNSQKQNLSEIINNYAINANELSKAFQEKIPEEFLNPPFRTQIFIFFH